MRTKKEKFRITTICLMVVFLVTILITSVSNDWATILENNRQIDTLSQEYQELLTEEEQLKSEVTKLQDSDYIARYAKEKYMYSSDGETIIRMD